MNVSFCMGLPFGDGCVETAIIKLAGNPASVANGVANV